MKAYLLLALVIAMVNVAYASTLSVEPANADVASTLEVSIEGYVSGDCTSTITSPSGVTKELGRSGCTSGTIMSFSTIMLEGLFGTVESGTYTFTVLVSTSSGQVMLEDTFVLSGRPLIKKYCNVTGGYDLCEFFGVPYLIRAEGVEWVDVEVTVGEKTQSLRLQRHGGQEWLGNGTVLRLASGSAQAKNFLFTKEVKPICGNGVCEQGESCDCDSEMPEAESSEGLECTSGCLYGNSCARSGAYTRTEYCDGESFQPRIAEGLSCSQGYHCIKGSCIDGICRPPCDGCYDGGCFAVGTLRGSEFCSGNQFEPLRAVGDACSMDVACQSRWCVAEACIEPSAYQQFTRWLKGLF
jgi:hypothetical protein